MTRIHIARDRQPLGNFSPHQVADGLKSGRFLPTDLAWQEPMETWKPLSEFTNLPEPEIDEDDLLLAPPPPPSTAAPSAPDLPQPAWERRTGMGLFSAIGETIRQVLSEPAATFRAMRKEGGFATPLTYYFALALLGHWTSMIYNIIIIRLYPEAMSGKMKTNLTPEMMLGSQIGAMVMAPFVILIMLFVSAGLIHLMLIALAGSEKRFEVTFRAACYAFGTISISLMVPMCGLYIYLICGVIYAVVALREAQGVSTGAATGAVLVPTLCCCGLGIGGYIFLLSVANLGTPLK